MKTAEYSADQRGIPEIPFSERNVFNQRLADFLNAIEEADGNLTSNKDKDYRGELMVGIESRLHSIEKVFPHAEVALFRSFWDLFQLKHGLTPVYELAHQSLFDRSRQGKMVQFIGALGVAKTTIAKSLAEDLRASLMAHEPHTINPFWARSQQENDLMLRSQVYFFLSNVFAGLRLLDHIQNNPEITVSDTSVFTDTHMWVPWYLEMKMMKAQEGEMYSRLINLLRPVVPRPDLLVALNPTSIEKLREGIKCRQQEETYRAGELIFTEEDLELEADICRRAQKELAEEWGIKVLGRDIDPIEIFRKPSLRYSDIHAIRTELDLLKGLIKPSPEEATDRIITFLWGKRGRLVLLGSPSMFTGKTETLLQVKERLGNRMVVLRPAITTRESFGEDETTLISRDGHKVEVISVGERDKPQTNDIRAIPTILAERGITPEDVSIIGIDEGMLWLANAEDPIAVINTIKYLTDTGFNVVFNGVTLNYKGEPFHYMDFLLYWAKADPKRVLAIQMITRCSFCEKPAQVTRLTDVDGNLEKYTGKVVLIGSKQYIPVCGTDHKSCEGRPPGLPYNQTPKSKEEYERVLKEAGVL